MLSKLHSNSNSADSNSSAAMLILPRNHVTPNSKNDWFKPFNSRQLVERNRAKFYFRSTTFNNFQHVERQISTFNITTLSTFVEQRLQHFSAQQMLNRVSLALVCAIEISWLYSRTSPQWLPLETIESGRYKEVTVTGRGRRVTWQCYF